MMAFQTQQLLNKLKLHYPCSFSYNELQEMLGESDTSILLNLGILREGKPMKSIFCPSCQNEHEVVIHSKTEAFVVCTDEDTGRIIVNPETLRTWQFDIPRFLELTAKELKIAGEIKNVVADDLWQMGKIKKDGKNFLVFYSRTNKLNSYSDFFDAFKSPIKNFVIFTNTETPLLKIERAEAVVIAIADIVEIKNKSLTWNTKLFQKHLLNAFRQVVFYSANGDLAINGKILDNIIPSTPEYFFIDILWQNFNQPVSHDSIFSYCKERLNKKNYSDTAQVFCNKMKSNIKKKFKNNAYVDKIFRSTKTTNGLNSYKMTNPE